MLQSATTLPAVTPTQNSPNSPTRWNSRFTFSGQREHSDSYFWNVKLMALLQRLFLHMEAPFLVDPKVSDPKRVGNAAGFISRTRVSLQVSACYMAFKGESLHW